MLNFADMFKEPVSPYNMQWAPTICHFFLLTVVIAGDCTMTLAFNVLQKICRIKISLQFISTFGRNIAIYSEYLVPVNRSPGMNAQYKLKSDVYELNRLRNRCYRYTTFA